MPAVVQYEPCHEAVSGLTRGVAGRDGHVRVPLLMGGQRCEGIHERDAAAGAYVAVGTGEVALDLLGDIAAWRWANNEGTKADTLGRVNQVC